MERSNPEYELILDVEVFLEKINEFLDFYQFLGSADNITRRFFSDMIQQLKDENFLNAKTCINKLIQQLDKERKNGIYAGVQNYFLSVIDTLKNGDKLCDKLLSKIDDGLDEKTSIKKDIKESNIRLFELNEEKIPYLNLSITIMLFIMSIVFVFLPNFFNNPILMYHLCGFMMLIGFVLLKQEIVFRNEKGFKSNSENSTGKRAIILLIQAFIYMIPLLILSHFFFDYLLLRIALFVQIFFCGILFFDGLFILINNLSNNKKSVNKKSDKKNVWGIILGIISILGFVLQLLQIWKVI